LLISFSVNGEPNPGLALYILIFYAIE
jgi:hypothetical protein